MVAFLNRFPEVVLGAFCCGWKITTGNDWMWTWTAAAKIAKIA
jgi:hypothetical protein